MQCETFIVLLYIFVQPNTMMESGDARKTLAEIAAVLKNKGCEGGDVPESRNTCRVGPAFQRPPSGGQRSAFAHPTPVRNNLCYEVLNYSGVLQFINLFRGKTKLLEDLLIMLSQFGRVGLN